MTWRGEDLTWAVVDVQSWNCGAECAAYADCDAGQRGGARVDVASVLGGVGCAGDLGVVCLYDVCGEVEQGCAGVHNPGWRASLVFLFQ